MMLALAFATFLAQVQDKPFLEEEWRREMDLRITGGEDIEEEMFLDGGGWFHFNLVSLDDHPIRKNRTLRYNDLRLWAQARINENVTAYVRLRTTYADFNSGDQIEGDKDDTYRLLAIDQAYVEEDYSTETEDFTIRLGRQFFTLGRGLLFNGVAQGGMASLISGPFSARAFAAHSVISDDDIDRSLPNADDSRRLFGGAELGWFLGLDHAVYFAGLIERDLNREKPTSPTQDWGYDATYYALGMRGRILGDLTWAGEGVYEYGEGFAAGSTYREAIKAWGLTLNLQYTPDVSGTPLFVVEYITGSGDRDRGSVTDTTAGNTLGTDDRAFLPFGFVQTGFALFPRISNIHILRFGGSCRPFESVEGLENLEFGAYGYVYRKDKKEAPISDPRSFLADREVGTELDLFLRWRVLSDVGISINYGRFFPGNAYVDNEPRDFLSTGVTYSF